MLPKYWISPPPLLIVNEKSPFDQDFNPCKFWKPIHFRFLALLFLVHQLTSSACAFSTAVEFLSANRNKTKPKYLISLCSLNVTPIPSKPSLPEGKNTKKMELIWIWFGFDLDFKNYLMDLDFNDFFNDLIWKFRFWTWFDLELIWRDSFFTDLILSLNKYQIQ